MKQIGIKIKSWWQIIVALSNEQKIQWGMNILALIFFLMNYKYLAYPDEFVNILGGKFILQGKVPYKDFFDHHLPFAWYYSAFLLLISFGNFITFRLFWALSNFLALFAVGQWIRKNHSDMYWVYLIFLVMYPVMAVYFWFHLYLGDSLGVLFFSITFWLLIVQTIQKKIDMKIIAITSLTTFCMFFSALTYIYLAMMLYVWQLYLIGVNKKNIIRWIIACATPGIVYLLYLVVTGSLKDFYISNFVYNTTLYIDIPNYHAGAHFNPLRFAFTILYNFWGNYLALLTQIKFLDLYLPIGTLAGLGTLTLLIVLLSRYPIVGFIYFLMLSFSAPRSNIQQYKETDYQACLFLVFGMVSSTVAIYLLTKTKYHERLFEDLKRISLVLMSIFLFFSFIFLVNNSYSKYYQRYMLVMPSIMDRGFMADFIDELINKDDYFWIGPFEPHEAFFVTKGKFPGKFPTLLPQFRENEYFKNAFLDQFNTNRPKVMIFKHVSSIFGTPATTFGAFFLSWMDGKYIRLNQIKNVEILRQPSNMDLSNDLMIRLDAKDEVLKKLKDKGYIEIKSKV
ncbi:MAG: hypothetical protein WCO06_02555 [Candidatus Roizmanbacteria bacterium]